MPGSEALGRSAKGGVLPEWTSAAACASPRRRDELRIGTVRHVHETDVVVLAVHAPQDRLIAPLEPVRADETGQGRGLLHVVAVSLAPLDLIGGLDQARAQPVGRHAEVELADDDRPAGDFVDPLHLPGRLVLVHVDAAHVERLGHPQDRLRRRAAEPDAQVQMVGVVLLDGLDHQGQVPLEHGVHEFRAPVGRVALGQELLELALGGGVRALEEQVHHLALAPRPGRLVADEVAQQPGIVLARGALLVAAAPSAAGELVRVHVLHPQERRLRAGRRNVIDVGLSLVRGRPDEDQLPIVVRPQASMRARDDRPALSAAPPAAHAVGARGQEEVSVRIDEPPPAVDLLDPEEAGGRRLGAGVAAVLAEAEVAPGPKDFSSSASSFWSCSRLLILRGQSAWAHWPNSSSTGSFFDELGPGVLLRQGDGPDLQGGLFSG